MKQIPLTAAADVFEWLGQFINVETGQFTTSLSLTRMRVLAELAGHPEASAPVIHVAGSKGKGSVTGMITAILTAQGYRAARYTSPHVVEYRERITLGDRFFPEDIYVEAGKELVAIEAALEAQEHPEFAAEGLLPEGSFFELLTLYFFLCARRAKAEVMVVETGLGGRLDATNIVDPILSVLTLIELEHTEFLGTTITAIAGEKAGIIKPRRPVLSMTQPQEALAVFQRVAQEREAPFFSEPDLAVFRDLRVDAAGTHGLLCRNSLGLGGGDRAACLPISVPIPGAVQGVNATLAALAATLAFPDVTDRAIVQGLGCFTLPARFERLSLPALPAASGAAPAPGVVIIDGAHTAQSVEACVETFVSIYGEGGVLLFGCAAHKDAEAMAKLLIPHFRYIVITTPGTFKVSYPEEVFALFQAVWATAHPAPTGDVPDTAPPDTAPSLLFLKDTAQAIDRVCLLGREQRLPVLGTGSFYLAAELRNALLPIK